MLIALVASLHLAACAGGGGGGASTTPVTPTPPAPPPPPPPPPPPQPPATNPSLPLNPPSTSSAEFQRNYALAATHADAAYALGATGKGITVAVIDSGFDRAGADMQGAYSPDSTDLVSGRPSNATFQSDRHGVEVAGVIAARFNGKGTIGVAYESTILAIRSDAEPAADCKEECVRFPYSSAAQAIDYAVTHGAKVINMSFGGDDQSPEFFRAAVARAAAAGVIFTASAGNDGKEQSEWPAQLGVDPQLAGSFLAVGALNKSMQLASFSNRAGVAAPGYILAPGQDVITDCGADESCWRVAGTSFSAPYVAGALALLLQYFPRLSGRDAIEILKRTTSEIGDPGVDSVYGNGVLNIAKAFQPVGAQSLSLAGGGRVTLLPSELGSALGGAFGDSVAASGALSTVIHDDYNRPFSVDLAQGYARRQRSGSTASVAQPTLDTAQAYSLPVGTTLTLAAQIPMFPVSEAEGSPVRTFLRPEEPSSVAAAVQVGGFSLTTWRGHGPTAAPAGLGGRNAFTSMAAPDRSVSAAWRAGRFAFGGEGGWAERRTALSSTPVDASAYATATAAYSGDRFALSISAGSLDEPRGALGSELSPDSPLSLAARTRFAAVGLDRPLATPVGRLMLRAEASVGRTQGGGKLVDVDQAVTSSWRLALSGACSRVLPCRGFGLELAQPLRVESGTFHALLADVPTSDDEVLTFSERRFSAAPSSRELDLRFNTDAALGVGTLRLQAAAAFNPSHQDGEADLGVSAAWRTSF